MILTLLTLFILNRKTIFLWWNFILIILSFWKRISSCTRRYFQPLFNLFKLYWNLNISYIFNFNRFIMFLYLLILICFKSLLFISIKCIFPDINITWIHLNNLTFIRIVAMLACYLISYQFQLLMPAVYYYYSH